MRTPDSDQVGDIFATQQCRQDGLQQSTLGLRNGPGVGRLAHRPDEMALPFNVGRRLNVGAFHRPPFWTR